MSRDNIKSPFAAILVFLCLAVYGQQESQNRKVSEKIITQVDASTWIQQSLRVSPDNRRIAWVAQKNNKQFVTVDGKEGKFYDGIGSYPIFSPDSKNLAYVANVNNRWAVVVNEKEDKPYIGITRDGIIFSPNSKHYTYGAGVGNKLIVVIDGKENKAYDGIMEGSPIFSPNSERIAYGAQIGHTWLMVIDGKEKRTYEGIGLVLFSHDSKRLAYMAGRGDKRFVVVDDTEEKLYDFIIEGNITFSPDSKRLAYAAGIKNRFFVVIDSIEGQSYNSIKPGSLKFSPDSKRVAYVAQAEGKWFVVVDGKEGKLYDDIDAALLFSPDGKRLAYRAKKNDKWIVVVDDEEQKTYDSLIDSPLIFSTNSKHLVYKARTGSKQFVVVDGKEERQYDRIVGCDPVFSPDSKYLAYGAGIGEKSFVVVNGKEGKFYDGIITFGGGKILFDSNDSLHYLALVENDIYLVEEDVQTRPHVAFSESDSADFWIAALRQFSVNSDHKIIEAIAELRDVRAIKLLIPLLWWNPKQEYGTEEFNLIDLRRKVEDILVNFGELAIPDLVAALKEPRTYDGTAECLLRIGEPAVEPIKALYQSLDNSDYNRQEIAFLLVRLGVADLNFLIEALKDDVGGVEKPIVNIGEPAIPQLINLLDDHGISWRASKILQQIGKPAAPALGQTLKHESKEMRLMAAMTLRDMEEKDEDIFLIILSEIDNSPDEDRAWAAYALRNSTSQRVRMVLLESLNNREIDVICGAYSFFIRLGKPGSEDILIEALETMVCGDAEMATAFLNSGNEKLRKAALTWAKNNGAQVIEYRQNTSHNPVWGENR